MERNYEAEYKALVNRTVRGTKIRAFFLGYNHERTERYFDSHQRQIFDLEHEATDKNREIKMTRENLNLEFKLFELRTRIIYSNMFFDKFPEEKVTKK